MMTLLAYSLLIWGHFYLHVRSCEAVSLDNMLHRYDTLHHRDIHHHHVTRRSTNGGKLVNNRIVSLDTLGRHFELHLTTNRKLFSPDFVAVEVRSNHNNAESHEFELKEDEFYEGYIVDDPESKVQAYYEHENMVVNIRTKQDTFILEPSWRHLEESEDYTMIAYKASDIKTDKEQHPGLHTARSFCGYVRNGVDMSNDTHNPTVEDGFPAYSYSEHHQHSHNRYRRQAVNLKVCPVVLVADHHFFSGVGESDVTSTSKYLAGVLSRVNAIYQDTNFGNGYDGMGFVIKQIIVHSGPTSDPAYNADQSYWDTTALLNSFGRENWSSFCLAHLFTYLAFDGGVQGLAWIASSRTNEVGGICSQVYQGRHYNTAWTSNRNSNGERILSQEADLVTAHEFGHNWGSPHDPSNCAPSTASGGKYVMYQYSVSGYDDNNDAFSSCSISSIGSVLQVKSGWCFTERTDATCGNNIVEDEEQCDPGLDSEDPCCTALCTLRVGKACSDKNSACCVVCQVASSSTVCRQASNFTCQAQVRCDGVDAECPTPQGLDNNVTCIDNGKCQGGECKKFCESQGKISCSCDELDTACFYCCRESAEAECTKHASSIQLDDGRSCYAGICNQGVCEPSKTKNTARLWDIIVDLDGNAILEWMRNNIVITIIVLSLFIYIPFCIAVWCIDRKNKKHDEKEVEWLRRDNDNLVRDGDNRRIRRANNPRRRQPYSRVDSHGASTSGVEMVY